jgi:Raf kinase inhibitor-like YbhB/YbcL family protein
MLKALSSTVALACAVAIPFAQPASAKDLKVKVGSIKQDAMIPNKFAFCQPAEQGHAGPAPDISPPISWTKGPKGTLSYAVILSDTDSPKENRDKMNKEGMTVPSTTARQTFYHWVVVDIPADVRKLKEGAGSTARVPHGKAASTTTVGVPGLNMFTMAFATNDGLKGKYFGYDGPCPPWNDENVHHYHFNVYALSVKSLGLPAEFDGPAAVDAMKDKILAQGKFDANYSTNPATGAVVPKK